ncbi:MAG: RsmE family RNA methyltransferase [Nannocystaceae bacterium]
MSLRVFAPTDTGPLEVAQTLTLTREESHYLSKVRRARVGSEVDVFDGLGGIWRAITVAVDARASRVELVDKRVLAAPPREVSVLLGTPQAPALLDALTRASEVGAVAVTLVHMQRSQGSVPKLQRIDRVLKAAQRQCGRPLPLAIEHAESLFSCPTDGDVEKRFAWAASRTASSKGGPPTQPAQLVIGPEGGLTPEEVTWLQHQGYTPLGLGPWVQRTETAVATGLARLIFAR